MQASAEESGQSAVPPLRVLRELVPGVIVTLTTMALQRLMRAATCVQHAAAWDMWRPAEISLHASKYCISAMQYFMCGDTFWSSVSAPSSQS